MVYDSVVVLYYFDNTFKSWIFEHLVQLMATETMNSQDQRERTVNAVDYRSSVGQGQEQKPVQVVHQPHPLAADATTSSGVLAGAAASVASTFQSAKEAISRK
ncbi:uncharacterized protein LOC130768139 [Actinidia eriantha]|uniref:uncharacterized protein LOC130768139 n=1 Tax=Actinidia eriantha TaxID=165200 RepID=UPI0025859689|nr:uncharacterized protein LOC130768139 [Actinidia eriantha]